MSWSDTGYLISKTKYNENSSIVEFYTKAHGKSTGIIFGSTSKKIKNYLQIGNKFFLNYISKNDNKIGYFKVEILKAFGPYFFEDKQRLLCLTSSLRLIKILTVEAESNEKIFNLLDAFFEILINDEWIKKYIFWELDLLKYTGYDLNLEKIAKKEITDDKKRYFVESKTEKKYVPNFLIELDLDENNLNNLISGLVIIGDYLDKSILRPNNIIYPIDRTNFINSLK
ncbi:MAG: DNA repair protein RecO [Candidatus Pelagibacter sp.]